MSGRVAGVERSEPHTHQVTANCGADGLNDSVTGHEVFFVGNSGPPNARETECIDRRSIFGGAKAPKAQRGDRILAQQQMGLELPLPWGLATLDPSHPLMTTGLTWCPGR